MENEPVSEIPPVSGVAWHSGNETAILLDSPTTNTSAARHFGWTSSLTRALVGSPTHLGTAALRQSETAAHLRAGHKPSRLTENDDAQIDQAAVQVGDRH